MSEHKGHLDCPGGPRTIRQDNRREEILMTDFRETCRADLVLSIADGRDRKDIDRRAESAFTRANRLRAESPRVDAARLAAIGDAVNWARVLHYLDRTGDSVFDRGRYGEPEGPIANTYGCLGTFKMLLGRKPFAFYPAPR